MKLKHIFYQCAIGLSLMLGTSASVLAEGEIDPLSGTHMYHIDFGDNDIENFVGATTEKEWNNSGAWFDGYVHCTQDRRAIHSIIYRMDTPLIPADSADGFLRLNEYLDVKIETKVYGSNSAGVYHTVYDHLEVDNKYNIVGCTAPGRVVIERQFASGSEGRVTFRVSKKIINGLKLRDIEILKVYGRLSPDRNYTTNYGSTPLSIVTIKAASIQVPDKCVINEGELVVIDFNELPTKGLDGQDFQRDIPVSFHCDGGSFEGKFTISLGVNGRVSKFSNDYLRTNNDDLGIKIMREGKLVIPNVFYPVTSNSTSGNWNLTAAPIARPGASLNEGSFEATATIVAGFN